MHRNHSLKLKQAIEPCKLSLKPNWQALAGFKIQSTFIISFMLKKDCKRKLEISEPLQEKEKTMKIKGIAFGIVFSIHNIWLCWKIFIHSARWVENQIIQYRENLFHTIWGFSNRRILLKQSLSEKNYHKMNSENILTEKFIRPK